MTIAIKRTEKRKEVERQIKKKAYELAELCADLSPDYLFLIAKTLNPSPLAVTREEVILQDAYTVLLAMCVDRAELSIGRKRVLGDDLSCHGPANDR
jgi:hypothetical protein